jgi:phosphoribosylpyrophosphate synthetase
MIDTAGTLVKAAGVAVKSVRAILAMVFYQVQHIKRIAKSSLTELVISDSLTSKGGFIK